jgi:hypothetical protein
MSDQDIAEMRGQMIDNAKDSLRGERKAAKTTLTALNGLHRHSAPSQVEPFLIGVQVGIQMGEFALEDLDGEIMRGESDE